MFFQQVCETLKKNGVTFAIVGGMAVLIHGVSRGTMDIDFVISWNIDQLRQVEKSLKALGLVSRIPIKADDIFRFRDEYINNRNLIAWNFYHPIDITKQVDVIITHDLDESEVTRIATRYGNIPVLSLESLIDMKRKSGRPQDLADVEGLLQIQKEKK